MFSGSKSTSRDNKTVGCRKSALDAHTIAQSHDITRTHLRTRKPQISCYSPTTRIWIVRRDLLFMQKWWWLRRNCWCQALPWYFNGSPLNHVQYVLITFGPKSASSMGKKVVIHVSQLHSIPAWSWKMALRIHWGIILTPPMMPTVATDVRLVSQVKFTWPQVCFRMPKAHSQTAHSNLLCKHF